MERLFPFESLVTVVRRCSCNRINVASARSSCRSRCLISGWHIQVLRDEGCVKGFISDCALVLVLGKLLDDVRRAAGLICQELRRSGIATTTEAIAPWTTIFGITSLPLKPVCGLCSRGQYHGLAARCDCACGSERVHPRPKQRAGEIDVSTGETHGESESDLSIGDRQLLNRALFGRREPQQEIARVDLRRARRDGRWIGPVAGCDPCLVRHIIGVARIDRNICTSMLRGTVSPSVASW